MRGSSCKTFYASVIPSVLAFALSGVYAIIDGLFVGRSLGDGGLAAMTLGYPVTAFIQAVGIDIGLAGAIRFAILKAQGKTREVRVCCAGSALLILLLGALLTALLLSLLNPILFLFGALGTIRALTFRRSPHYCVRRGLSAFGDRICSVYPQHGRSAIRDGGDDFRLCNK
ncbi:MAG: MATE family efflux transporter [Treponema sp.]